MILAATTAEQLGHDVGMMIVFAREVAKALLPVAGFWLVRDLSKLAKAQTAAIKKRNRV